MGLLGLLLLRILVLGLLGGLQLRRVLLRLGSELLLLLRVLRLLWLWGVLLLVLLLLLLLLVLLLLLLLVLLLLLLLRINAVWRSLWLGLGLGLGLGLHVCGGIWLEAVRWGKPFSRAAHRRRRRRISIDSVPTLRTSTLWLMLRCSLGERNLLHCVVSLAAAASWARSVGSVRVVWVLPLTVYCVR